MNVASCILLKQVRSLQRLHVMQHTIKKAVHPSVHQTHRLWHNKRNLCPNSHTAWKNVYPSFPTRRMVGEGRPHPEISGQTHPIWAKNAFQSIFPRSASVVFGQNWPTQQSHDLFVAAKFLVLLVFVAKFLVLVLMFVHFCGSSVSGRAIWNWLSDSLTDPAINRDCFKRLLKTFLFSAYSWT